MTSLAAQLTTLPQGKQKAFVNSLSNQDAYVLLLALEAEECRASLKLFLKAVWHIIEPTPFVDGWVIDCLCEHFMALACGEIRKIVVNIPPRHTKSLFLVAFRAWLWARNAQEQVLAASYNLDLSLRDNLRVRRIVEDPWYQSRFGTEVVLRPDQKAKFYFEDTAAGYQMALSVAGGVTGQGGSYLIIDDAHDASEAHSEKDRDKALTWFREVWTNRLNDQSKDKMVVVGQRIHESDICGYIIKERPDWVHLSLPAYYEPARRCVTPVWSDPREEENELLWPQRFSVETLDGLRRDLGAMGFAAQYQQHPTPAGGGQFKSRWFRYFTSEDECYILETPEETIRHRKSTCWHFATVDLAISLKQTADYTVIATWAVTPDRDLLLVDCLHDHLDNPEQQKQISLAFQKHHPDYFKVENVAYQLALIQQLRRQGLPVREYKPIKDKVSRASSASVFYEGGKVYHPKSVHWIAEWEEELLLFPNAAHDDRVDVTSMACDEISGPLASASDHVDAMKRRVVLAQSRSAQTVPAGGVTGWQR
jgi:predicted phage terminase large subunit-like protein